eukprot:CAMPEP_0118922130 /NCGR_PEP_ID=MMETSP1169-20130426/1162_1 /TAXON_ID=36882 /ORGANISM="Pyramimonas obovata, Strain CCMP722" /LENGTH=633 /DNA_ID=CAMNT_0006862957 /DNA_START=137 /DNA_END=2035 /DNA_ORIENTATION=-
MGARYSLSGLLLALLVLSHPLAVRSGWFSVGLGWHDGDKAPAPPSPENESENTAGAPEPAAAPEASQPAAAPEASQPAPAPEKSDSGAEAENQEPEQQESEPQEAEQQEESAAEPISSAEAIRLTPPGVYQDITARKPEEPPAEDGACVPEGQEDACWYLQNHNDCWKERQSFLVDYKTFYYCTCGGSIVGLIPLFIWSIVIFYALAIAADMFFCPAVDSISEIFKLPPDVAGATLLSFGNGAPDVFTQFAAITHGSRPDVLLALSSVLGSGFFIACAILGVVVMVAPQPLELDWTFKRDTLAYLGSVLCILVFMADGKVEWYQSAFLFVYYVGYLVMVIFYGTNTASDDDEEEGPGYIKRTNTVREFGIHPTITWVRNIVQWESLTLFQKLCTPMTVPVKLVLSLTMTPEEPGRVYGAVIAVCAPIFFLISMGVQPGEHSRFFFIFFSMVLLSSALYATSSVELVVGPWLMPTVTFIQSILWMKAAASTLVELLELVGMVCGIPPAFLGATVLAWGASTADLAANVSIARRNPKMAVAACIAGPLFNLLAGMSSSLLYQNMLYGDVLCHLDNGVLLLIGVTAVLMLYMAVAVPFFHKYVLSRFWANVLFSLYVGFTIVYVMQQMGVIWTDAW